jgi:hypothetical protein
MMEKVLNFASDHQQLVDLYRDATGKRPFEYGSMFGNEKVGSEILLSQAIHQSDRSFSISQCFCLNILKPPNIKMFASHTEVQHR